MNWKNALKLQHKNNIKKNQVLLLISRRCLFELDCQFSTPKQERFDCEVPRVFHWSSPPGSHTLQNIKCIHNLQATLKTNFGWQVQMDLYKSVAPLHCKRRSIGEECKQRKDLCHTTWNLWQWNLMISHKQVSWMAEHDNLTTPVAFIHAIWWCFV